MSHTLKTYAMRVGSAVKNTFLLVVYVGGTLITITGPSAFFLFFLAHRTQNPPGIAPSFPQTLFVTVINLMMVCAFVEADDEIFFCKNYQEELFLKMNPVRVYLWVFPQWIFLLGRGIYRIVSARIPKTGLHMV